MADQFADSYDFRLTIDGRSVGFTVLHDENGLRHFFPSLAPMINPQFNTGEYGYLSYPQEYDVPAVFEDWSYGCGWLDAGKPTEFAGYNYSQSIDASWPQRLMLSAKRFNADLAIGGGTGASPAGFLDSSHGLFMIAGKYIYKWEPSTRTFIVKNDASGDSSSYTSMVEMDGTIYAFRGDQIPYKYSVDGDNWTVSNTNEYGTFAAVRGVDAGEAVLWRVKNDGTMKNTTDAKNEGVAWSGATAVGHTSETVNGLIEAEDDLYIFKKEGIYRNTGTEVEDVWLGGRNMLRDGNGKNPFLWTDGRVYVPYGDSLLAYTPVSQGVDGNSLRAVFPADWMLGNLEVNGQITAVGGDAKWLYIALKNSKGNTYIIKGDPRAETPTWHTVLYLGVNDCNFLFVSGPGTGHISNPVLFAGYGDSVSYYILARQNLTPEHDSNYVFESSGTISGAWTGMGAKAFPKFLNQGRIITGYASSSQKVSLYYETDTSGSDVLLVTAQDIGENFSNVSNEVRFNRIRYSATMATGDTSSTPVVHAISLHGVPNNPRKRQWTADVVVGNNLQLRNGTYDTRQSGKYLEYMLFQSSGKRVILKDRHNRTYNVRVISIDSQGVIPSGAGSAEYEKEIYRVVMGEISQIDLGTEVAVYGRDRYGQGKVYS